MCKTPRPRATIRSEGQRLSITFSDGRTHYLEHAPYLAADRLIAAAVHWCKRHGADVVEISF